MPFTAPPSCSSEKTSAAAERTPHHPPPSWHNSTTIPPFRRVVGRDGIDNTLYFFVRTLHRPTTTLHGMRWHGACCGSLGTRRTRPRWRKSLASRISSATTTTRRLRRSCNIVVLSLLSVFSRWRAALTVPGWLQGGLFCSCALSCFAQSFGGVFCACLVRLIDVEAGSQGRSLLSSLWWNTHPAMKKSELFQSVMVGCGIFLSDGQ